MATLTGAQETEKGRQRMGNDNREESVIWSPDESESAIKEMIGIRQMGLELYGKGEYEQAMTVWKTNLRSVKYVLNKNAYEKGTNGFREMEGTLAALLLNLAQAAIQRGLFGDAISFCNELSDKYYPEWQKLFEEELSKHAKPSSLGKDTAAPILQNLPTEAPIIDSPQRTSWLRLVITRTMYRKAVAFSKEAEYENTLSVLNTLFTTVDESNPAALALQKNTIETKRRHDFEYGKRCRAMIQQSKQDGRLTKLTGLTTYFKDLMYCVWCKRRFKLD